MISENNSCLIEELRKLKESSKEAVENIDSFSSFKKYMHIKRKVQDELLDLIEKSVNSPKSQLILVCGGVGDGKSHLISYLKEEYSYINDNFYIHNDATESFEPSKTSMDTLNELLIDFTDENLNNGSNQKFILAINLGALSNFIDSDYRSAYKKLRDYVINKGILESKILDNSFNNESPFQYINFSDYHMYSLTEDGPTSLYMKSLIEKITKPKDDNPFYKLYQKRCLQSCNCSSKCPVKFNYEFLGYSKNQDRLIQILIEGIIKSKLIISTRAFLNFLYDTMVANYIDNIPNSEIHSKIDSLDNIGYFSYLTPNLLFEHEGLSNIFEVISKLDPLNIRNEKLDSLLIKLNTIEDISSQFSEYIDIHQYIYLTNVLSDKKYINSFYNDNFDKNRLIKFFIRLYKFNPKTEDISLADSVYSNYTKQLYFWNKGSKSNLKKLYADIRESIYKWNSESDDNSINLFIGRNQLKYRISQKHYLEPDLSNLNEVTDIMLHRFVPYLILIYKREGLIEGYEINIDYSLYLLLMKVRNGYRPNKKDKENFVGFVEFIDKILLLGEQDKELIFDDKLSEDISKYRLSFDKNFNEYSFTEI